MVLEDLLGRFATLTIDRFSASGAHLATRTEGDRSVILLLGSEVPVGAKVGDDVRVFVYLDSEGRPLATTRTAKLELGQVAFLEVRQCTPIGAFVDWGLEKELLVPFAEQTSDMHEGQRYAIGLYLDDTGRLAGTMRVSEMIEAAKGIDWKDWKVDEYVQGEAWRNDPDIGLFVIVEKEFVGLLPKSEPHNLSRGEAARFRVSNVLHDGKIVLSLRAHAHQELAGDAQRILEILSRPNAPRVGDKSSPDEIRELFGLSKKAFKRAVGRLLKERAISIDDAGFVLIRAPA